MGRLRKSMEKDSILAKETMPLYIGEDKKRYGAKYQLGDLSLVCYSKKQVNALYPKEDYNTAAEYAPGSDKSPAGILDYNETELKLSKYKSHSRVFYSEKGFVSVGEDSFVVLLKNMVALRVIASVLCIAVIVAGALLAVNLIGSKESIAVEDEIIAAAGTEENALLDLEEGAVDWEGAKPRDTGGVRAGIAIPGYKSITIDAGKTDVKVNLQNPDGNPCYFIISLVLDDGTELYKSKMIEPGKGLYEITISKALDVGEYPAIVKYETYSLGELNPLNGAEVKIMLIAQ